MIINNKTSSFGSLLLGAMFAWVCAVTQTQAAPGGAVLDKAVALYTLDFADSGAVQGASQIKDSSGNGHHASAVSSPSEMTWIRVPATGPTSPQGTPSVGPKARGLDFAPLGDGGTLHPVFTVASGFPLSSPQSIVSRIRFDGPLEGSQQAWIFNKSNAQDGRGYLFGIREVGKDFVLAVYTTAKNSTKSASKLILTPGAWYDIAVVWDDHGTEDASDDTLSFYLGGKDGIQSQTFSRITLPTDLENGFLRVGAESADPKVLKAFDGAIDYVALFDSALSSDEIKSLFTRSLH